MAESSAEERARLYESMERSARECEAQIEAGEIPQTVDYGVPIHRLTRAQLEDVVVRGLADSGPEGRRKHFQELEDAARKHEAQTSEATASPQAAEEVGESGSSP